MAYVNFRGQPIQTNERGQNHISSSDLPVGRAAIFRHAAADGGN